MTAIPFILTALFTIWLSATGMEPIALITGIFTALCLSTIFSLLCLGFRVEPRWRPGQVICICVLITLSVLITQWPLRLTFALSRPAMERMARSLRAGQKFHGPQWAGVFLIRGVAVWNKGEAVCLWTVLEPSGNTGFIVGPPDIGNPWAEVKLGGQWRHLTED